MEKIQLKIRRQESPHSPSYWEEFEVKLSPSMTVAKALREIQKKPVNLQGKKTTPVLWGGSCEEEVCGGCTMLVHGRAVLGCATLLSPLKSPVVIEPLKKFPLFKDLLVNREEYFRRLNTLSPWIETGFSKDPFSLESLPLGDEEEYLLFSGCTFCGACWETCPQASATSDFLGASHLHQALLSSLQPGKSGEKERMHSVMGKGGITDCGHVGSCEAVCPKKIPLSTSLARLARKTTWEGLKKLLGE